MTISYTFNGHTHHMSRDEFRSVRPGDSWQNYAHGDLPAYDNRVAQDLFLMKDRFNDDEIADLTGSMVTRIDEMRKRFGLRRSCKTKITEAQDRIIRSGIHMARIMGLTGLDDQIIRQYARDNKITIPKHNRPYTDADLALFDQYTDNGLLGRLLNRPTHSISGKRRNLTKARNAQRSAA